MGQLCQLGQLQINSSSECLQPWGRFGEDKFNVDESARALSKIKRSFFYVYMYILVSPAFLCIFYLESSSALYLAGNVKTFVSM